MSWWHRCGRKCLVAGLVALTAGMGGCLKVTTAEKNVDQPLRTYTTTKKSEDAQPRAQVVAATYQPSSVKLTLSISRGKHCTTVEHRVVDRTRVSERRLQGNLFWYYALGLAGAGAGSYMMATANGSSSKRNWGIGLAAAGALALGVAVGNSINAIDSSKHIGHVDLVGDTDGETPTPCDAQPLGGALVTLKGARTELAKGRADESGRVQLSVNASDVAPGDDTVEVVVNGQGAGPIHALERYAAAATKRDQAERRAKAQAARDAVVAAEIKSGRCSGDRYNRLQQAMVVLKHLFDSASSGSGTDYFTIIGHDAVVATPDGTPLEMSDWLGGELHVFAVGFDPVKLDVRDAKGYALTTRSPWERLVGSVSDNTDSRVLMADSGDKYTLKVKGKGCALVLAVRKE